MKKLACSIALLAVTFTSGLALGQVTAGATEVEVEAPVNLTGNMRDGAVQDTTELSLQAGALAAGGNARTAAGTGATRFFKRMGAHEITNQNALNYARTGTPEGGLMETTVENYQARLRYEYFFSNNVAAFLSTQARRDRFQGLNLRLGVDPGLAYYFIRNLSSRFWLEGGYDFQFEDRSQDTVDLAAAAGTPIDKTEVDHNIRVYSGYDQKLDDRLHLFAGLEYFKSFTQNNAWRLNWETTLNVKLMQKFSLAIGSMALYNNDPLPGIRKFDVTSSLSFVYTLM